MQTFLGKKILILTAHPDDESYAAAGSIFKNYQSGGQNFLICSSRGERGRSHLKKPVTDAQLKKIRRKELLKAGKLFHLSRIWLLNFPDGKIKNFTNAIYRKSLPIVKKIKPKAILSFGSDGITGHLDHIAMGKVAKKLARKFQLPLYAFALPPTISRRALIYFKARRKFGKYANKSKFPKPNLKISINPRVKKRIICCHLSQIDNGRPYSGFPAFAIKELLNAEYFIVSK